MDKPPLLISALIINSIAAFSYNKLQLRTTGPYRMAKVRPNIIIIHENRVDNTVSIHWVSCGPNASPDGDKDAKDTSTRYAAASEDQGSSDRKKVPNAIERIVRHCSQ